MSVDVKWEFVRTLSVEQLPEGAKKALQLNGHELLLCHTSSGIFAVSNLCSHAREKLECGRMSRGWIACPVHGARFELASGRAMNPPAKQPIATYEVRVQDGWIEVRVPA